MMAEKKSEGDKKGLNPLMVALVALGVALSFALGFILGGQVGGGAAKVVLSDGTRLEDRLAQMEESMGGGDQIRQTMGEISDRANKILLGEVKKLMEGKVIDMAVPPVTQLDLRLSDRFASKGPDDPVITLVEFSDYQCPYCARMASALDELLGKNPDRIRLIFVDRPLVSDYRDGFPFHPYAFIAHEASIEAKAQGKFWEMYKYIFDNQGSLFPGRPKDKKEYEEAQNKLREKFVDVAKELGMDPEKMKKSLFENTHRKELEKTIALVDSMGIHSTPTVYMDGFFKVTDPNAIVNILGASTEIR